MIPNTWPMYNSVLAPPSSKVLRVVQLLARQGVRRVRLRRDLFADFFQDMTDGRFLKSDAELRRGLAVNVFTVYGPILVAPR